MSEDRHQPGPWTKGKRGEVMDGNGENVVVAVGGLRIATGDNSRDATPVANGNLVLAAPTLYHELRHLVRLLEPLERDGGLDVPGLATLNGARRALKMAEGEGGDDADR